MKETEYIVKYEFSGKYIHLLSLTENVKTQSIKILTFLTVKEPWMLLNPKHVLHLELLMGNEKNVNDRNKNDDIIPSFTAEKKEY